MKPKVILLAGSSMGAGPPPAAHQSDPVIVLIEQFIEADGRWGAEGPVRGLCERKMRKAGEVSTDGLGSVIASVPANLAGPRFMIDAHLD